MVVIRFAPPAAAPTTWITLPMSDDLNGADVAHVSVAPPLVMAPSETVSRVTSIGVSTSVFVPMPCRVPLHVRVRSLTV